MSGNVSSGNLSSLSPVTNTTKIKHYVFTPKYGSHVLIMICSILTLVIIVAIIGNIFIISVICSQKTLRVVKNYLILSLAFTDLILAVSVMPLGLVNEISIYWFCGSTLCDLWTTLDVLCCSASIFHLVVISLDRYWSVSDVLYTRRRTVYKVTFMIACAWSLSIMTSIPPLLGWKDPESDLATHGRCIISQELGFAIYSTSVSFYVPFAVILIINFKTYLIARSACHNETCVDDSRSAVHADKFADLNHTHSKSCPGNVQEEHIGNETDVAETNTLTGISKAYKTKESRRLGTENLSCSMEIEPRKSTEQINENCSHELRLNDKLTNSYQHSGEKKNIPEIGSADLPGIRPKKKDHKAARVLAVVTGTFIACWLPFFVLTLLSPLCDSMCNLPDEIYTVCTWLGYSNSSLNPFIYTIFIPSFRTVFKRTIRKFVRPCDNK